VLKLSAAIVPEVESTGVPNGPTRNSATPMVCSRISGTNR
jgi:hypothetical protein